MELHTPRIRMAYQLISKLGHPSATLRFPLVYLSSPSLFVFSSSSLHSHSFYLSPSVMPLSPAESSSVSDTPRVSIFVTEMMRNEVWALMESDRNMVMTFIYLEKNSHGEIIANDYLYPRYSQNDRRKGHANDRVKLDASVFFSCDPKMPRCPPPPPFCLYTDY